MFGGGDDDDDDFSLGGPIKSAFSSEGSNLASLFGGGSGGPSQSLTYTAPKQPRKNTLTQADDGKKKPAGTPSTVLQAAAVHCYKLVSGQYENVGKVGAALLGAGQGSTDYRILLYITQQKPVANATVVKGFRFEVLPNRYARFYDDSQTLYSVVFDKQEVLDKFSKQVALAISHVSQPLAEVLTQEMQVGDGDDSLQTGDAAELKYTGWVFSNGQLTQVIDSNVDKDKVFTLKLGKGKVIKGWEQGLVGMKLLGRRLIVIPPHLGYGEQGVPQRVPPNSTLAFEVHVLRMKKAQSAAPPQATLPAVIQPEEPAEHAAPPSLPSIEPTSNTLSVQDSSSVRERTRSMNEQMEHSTSESSLKTRMAKLGTAMLPMPAFNQPLPGNTDPASEIPDTPVEQQPELVTDHQYKPQSIHSQPATQPLSQSQLHTHHTSQSQPPKQVQSAFQPISTSHRSSPSPSPSMTFGNLATRQQMMTPDPLQQQMYLQQMMQQQLLQQQQQQFMPQQSAASGMWGQMPFLAGMNQQMSQTPGRSSTSADNPTSDYNSAQLEKKLDSISEQIERLQTTPSNIPSMETRVLLENLTRIIKENDKLKLEVVEKSKKVEDQNEKISSLLQESQRHVEQSNTILEQRNDSYKNTAHQSQARILELEEEKNELSSKLSTVMSQLTSSKLTVSELRKSEVELKEQVSLLTEKDIEVKATADTLKAERAKRREAESRLSSLEDEITELKDTISSLNKTLTERKQKSLDDRERFKQEVAELQTQHDEELSALRSRYQEKHSSESSKRVSELEEELEAKWKSKMADALSAAKKDGEKKVNEVQEEKDAIRSQAVKLKEKLVALKEMYDEKLEELQSSQEEVEELSTWKEKFDKLKEYTKSMKENYDGEIQELEEMITNIKQKTRVIFSSLAGLFDSDENYKGSDIRQAIQGAIKGQKLSPLQPVIIQVQAYTTGAADVPSVDPGHHKQENNETDNSATEAKVEPMIAYKLGDQGVTLPVKDQGMGSDDQVTNQSESPSSMTVGEPVEAILASDSSGADSAVNESKVEPEVAYKLGDKGLENTVTEPKVEPEVAYKLGDKGVENTVTEPEVEPEVAYKLGDKGIENTVTEPKVEPEVAYKLGDKGVENTVAEPKVEPEVAYKLGDKGKENTITEPKVEPEVAYKLGDKGVENTVTEPEVEPEVAYKLGDKGIENTVTEPKVEPEVAYKLGDKGIENTVTEPKVEPEVAYKLGDKGIENTVTEPKVEPEVAYKSGDKGIENTVTEPKVEPEVAYKLGDKGIENTVTEPEVEPKAANKATEIEVETVNPNHKSESPQPTSSDKAVLFDSDSDDEFVKGLTTPKSPPDSATTEKPPPLFDDDEDEEDLDWLS